MRGVTVGDLESIHQTFKGLQTPLKRQFGKNKPGKYFGVPKALFGAVYFSFSLCPKPADQ